mmetsp:Transcript_12151/g.30824  ORF Transcript_12151/g.30824 Transcript_12151/m.30824 type:complete len:328 (-) Transcript_12151:206-1189(-)
MLAFLAILYTFACLLSSSFRLINAFVHVCEARGLALEADRNHRELHDGFPHQIFTERLGEEHFVHVSLAFLLLVGGQETAEVGETRFHKGEQLVVLSGPLLLHRQGLLQQIRKGARVQNLCGDEGHCSRGHASICRRSVGDSGRPLSRSLSLARFLFLDRRARARTWRAAVRGGELPLDSPEELVLGALVEARVLAAPLHAGLQEEQPHAPLPRLEPQVLQEVRKVLPRGDRPGLPRHVAHPLDVVEQGDVGEHLPVTHLVHGHESRSVPHARAPRPLLVGLHALQTARSHAASRTLVLCRGLAALAAATRLQGLRLRRWWLHLGIG